MIIESFIEVVAPTIGRMLTYIVLDIIGHFICYNLGFVFLRLISMGKYPRAYYPTRFDDNDEAIVMVAGVFIVITLALVVFS